MMDNFILRADSYKYSHRNLYPPGTTNLYSYFESRGGVYPSTMFVGLQYYLMEYMTGNVFDQDDVKEAADFITRHGEPFDSDGWNHLWRIHGGSLPLRIKAVPEGLVIPTSNVLFTVDVTDPEFYWLSSWVETLLSKVWFPCTVGSLSYHIKQDIKKYLELSSDDPEGEIGFKLHDFGYRGTSSEESAAIGGLAHLVNFMGSDTIAGVWAAQKYYGTKTGMPGFSIPATEHSTHTAWGRDREDESYANAVKQFAKPGAVFACVSDSTDLFRVVGDVWGGSLGKEVEKSGATVVVRPDSGKPSEVVLKCLRVLASRVGASVNTKGFMVLPKWIRVIQGDGINHDSIEEILETITQAGFSASNIAFGMGGGLLQQVNRDTQKFAYKCSEATIDGKAVEVYKAPITDLGKQSKRGRLALSYGRHSGNYSGGYMTVNEGYLGVADILETVFEDGEIKKTYTFDEVRENSNK